MFLVLIVIGTLNFGLGFALAIYLPELPVSRLSLARLLPARCYASKTEPEEEDQTLPTLCERPDKLPLVDTDYPQLWLAEVLDSAGSAHPLATATARLLQLPIGEHRRELLAIEAQRIAWKTPPSSAAQLALHNELIRQQRSWEHHLQTAAEHLAQHPPQESRQAATANRLTELLKRQLATLAEQLCEIDEEELATVEIQDSLQASLQDAHQLQAAMADTLAEILRAGNQLHDLPAVRQFDPLTSLRNRLGLEAVIDLWQRRETPRPKMVMLILVRFERLADINRQFGTYWGDRLLAAGGHLLEELVRSECGFDVTARLDGSTFALLYGDTSLSGAVSAAERIRQSFLASIFEVEEQEIDLAVSCAVQELDRDASSACSLRDASEVLQQALAAGGNCTWINEGSSPRPLESVAKLPVKGRTIQLDTN